MGVSSLATMPLKSSKSFTRYGAPVWSQIFTVCWGTIAGVETGMYDTPLIMMGVELVGAVWVVVTGVGFDDIGAGGLVVVVLVLAPALLVFCVAVVATLVFEI